MATKSPKQLKKSLSHLDALMSKFCQRNPQFTLSVDPRRYGGNKIIVWADDAEALLWVVDASDEVTCYATVRQQRLSIFPTVRLQNVDTCSQNIAQLIEKSVANV